MAKSLRDRALKYRLDDVEEEDFIKFFEDLEKMCIEIDKKLGIKPIEATWN